MFRLTYEPIRVEELEASLADPRAGGCVTFTGRVRNHHEGRAVTRRDYEAYDALALSEGRAIIEEALGRFDVLHVVCEHRVGALAIGDAAIWIGVTAAHRRDAFLACEYVIDQVKSRVPIWKKEYYAGGDPRWVACCAHSVQEALSP